MCGLREPLLFRWHSSGRREAPGDAFLQPYPGTWRRGNGRARTVVEEGLCRRGRPAPCGRHRQNTRNKKAVNLCEVSAKGATVRQIRVRVGVRVRLGLGLEVGSGFKFRRASALGLHCSVRLLRVLPISELSISSLTHPPTHAITLFVCT